MSGSLNTAPGDNEEDRLKMRARILEEALEKIATLHDHQTMVKIAREALNNKQPS
jgi:hypothetical protein